MTKNEYNGWTNYETWVVNIWMTNDQGSSTFWSERAQELLASSEATEVFTKEESARFKLANVLKEHHEEALPNLEGFSADLLNAALSEVNWDEIAKGLIESAKEELAG